MEMAGSKTTSLRLNATSAKGRQIDIPAREYKLIENGEDEQGNVKYDKVAVPFDMSKVVISLWEVE